MLLLPPSLPLTHSPELVPNAAPAGPQPQPPTAVDPDAEPTLLRHPQARPRARVAGVGWASCPRRVVQAAAGQLGCPRHPHTSAAHLCLPRRARWSSPPTCPLWAATPSCSTASSRPTPPSPWRSSSTAAASGRVSGYGGWWGRTPDEGPVGVSPTRCGSMAHAAQSTVPVIWLWVTGPHPPLLSVIKRGDPVFFVVPDFLGLSHSAPRICSVNQDLFITHTGDRGLVMGGRVTARVFLCACAHLAKPTGLRVWAFTRDNGRPVWWGPVLPGACRTRDEAVGPGGLCVGDRLAFLPLQATPTPASARTATAAVPWCCVRARPSWT